MTDPMQVLVVRIPADMHAQVKAVAATDERTMAWVVRRALRDYLARVQPIAEVAAPGGDGERAASREESHGCPSCGGTLRALVRSTEDIELIGPIEPIVGSPLVIPKIADKLPPSGGRSPTSGAGAHA